MYPMKKDPIKIIYEDGHIIVVEKAEGVLSVSTSRGINEVTAHSLLNNYVRNTAGNGALRSIMKGADTTETATANSTEGVILRLMDVTTDSATGTTDQRAVAMNPECSSCTVSTVKPADLWSLPRARR